MPLVSFDPLRTLGLEDTLPLKPDQLFSRRAAVEQADWVLFPEYWQVGALVYGMRKRIFPSLASYLLGHSKIDMTRAFLAVAPAYVPETHIRANTPHAAEELWDRMARPFVAKIPRSSQGEGVFLIEERREWRAYLERSEVLYVQEHLPIDRDLRIVIVGGQVLAAYWRLQSPYSFHNNIARGGEAMQGPVPQPAVNLALRVATALEIDHAGFDVAMVGGHPYLLEFNRLFGNQGVPGGQRTVLDAIRRYLDSHSSPQSPLKPQSPRQGGRRRLRRAA